MATKKPAQGMVCVSPVSTCRRDHALDAAGCPGAHHLVDGVVPDDLDLGVLEQAVLHDLLGAQAVAAVDQRDLGGEIGQEQRLFDGGVAAADHDDLLAAIEEPVAGGAGRDAEALEMLLRGQAEPFRLRPGGKDHGVGGVGGAAVALAGRGVWTGPATVMCRR
jgi:hypothetical protein